MLLLFSLALSLSFWIYHLKFFSITHFSFSSLVHFFSHISFNLPNIFIYFLLTYITWPTNNTCSGNIYTHSPTFEILKQNVSFKIYHLFLSAINKIYTLFQPDGFVFSKDWWGNKVMRKDKQKNNKKNPFDKLFFFVVPPSPRFLMCWVFLRYFFSNFKI